MSEDQIQINILNNTIDLDDVCYECSESWKDPYYDEPLHVSDFKPGYENGEKCDTCNGKRFTLTKAGEAIMALVKRHTAA